MLDSASYIYYMLINVVE